MNDSVNTTQDRTVRVFISSTFRDMQAERDHLIKYVFPELRARCKERQVEFVEVDLRWGITEEQAERGEVLPLCLSEIEHCRPYFISMLGERYGYVPETVPAGLLDDHPWLDEHRESSITEMEIVHGVLNVPEMSSRAFFYLRDPSFHEQLPDEDKLVHLSENSFAETKLVTLKNRIKECSDNVRENYLDPVSLGEMVLSDLWSAIDKEFPAESGIDPLDRLFAEHKSYARSRSRVYIGRQEYFDRLDCHVLGDGPPLVILGESGSGKSAFLANWLQRSDPAVQQRESRSEDFIFYHFTGSSPQSTDLPGLLTRLLGEIKRHYRFTDSIPTELDKLREAFPVWLARAAASNRNLVLLFDGINQLEDRDNAHDLGWLPEHFPPNVRVVISTLPGRCLEALNQRNWQNLTITPLDTTERKQLAFEYLAVYRKTLRTDRIQRIINASQTANPLYLRSLLEELRIFGVHEQLDERISHYLSAESVVKLFRLILERYEQDYDKNRQGLVRDAMSLIWAARLGISEYELTSLLGDSDKPLPSAYWSPLYLATEQNLVNRSGLISFSHDYFRQAVELRYLNDPQSKQLAHKTLATFFKSLNLDVRKVAELPWQQYQANDNETLCQTLTQPNTLIAAVEFGKLSDWGMYWSHLNDKYDVVYEHVIAVRVMKKLPEYNDLQMDYLEASGLVLEYLGYYGDAEHFYAEELLEAQHLGNDNLFVIINNRLIDVLVKQNKFKEAMERLTFVYEMSIEIPILCSTILKLAGLYAEQGYFEGADSQLKHAEQYIEDVSSDTVGSIFLARATLAVLTSQFSNATLTETATPTPVESSLAAQDYLRREYGINHPKYAEVLRCLAKAYLMVGLREDALRRAIESVDITMRLFGSDHPETGKSHLCLAEIYFEESCLNEAENLYSKALAIFQKHAVVTMDHAQVLGRLAIIFRSTNRVSDAGQLENMADLLRDEAVNRWGTISPAFMSIRTSSGSAGINKAWGGLYGNIAIKGDHWENSFSRIGKSIIGIIAAITFIVAVSGLQYIVFGPLTNHGLSMEVPRPVISAISFIFGHIILSLNLYVLHVIIFDQILIKHDNKSGLGVIKFVLSYTTFVFNFIIMRDYLRAFPSNISIAFIVILGILIILFSVLPYLVKLITKRNIWNLHSQVITFVEMLLLMIIPKSALKSMAIKPLGPKVDIATKKELVDAIVGNFASKPASISVKLPVGLSVYDENENMTKKPENIKKISHLDEVKSGIIIGVCASILDIGAHLKTMEILHTIAFFAFLVMFVYLIAIGIKTAKKCESITKTVAFQLVIIIPIIIISLAIQGRLIEHDLIENLTRCILMIINILVPYWITRIILYFNTRASVPAPSK